MDSQEGLSASNRKDRCVAVTLVQRFGNALYRNLQLHTVALDGIYLEDEQGYVAFRCVAPPGDGEVARVARRVHRRVAGATDVVDLEEPVPFKCSEPVAAAA